MENDEAEATLLSLAQSLEWYYPFPDKPHLLGARVGSAIYACCLPEGKTVFNAGYYSGSSVGGVASNIVIRNYPTFAEAKAACERHHATGQWEPLPLSEQSDGPDSS